MLAEGAILEQLRRQPGIRLDEEIANAGLIYDPESGAAMSAVVSEYARIAAEAGLPLLLTTPTWRAQPDRVARSQWRGRPVNAGAVEFARAIGRASGARFQLAGLIGPRGDCYRAEESPDAAAARAYHRTQVLELAGAGVDWILAATLPSLREALGIAALCEEAARPVVPSFVLAPDGRLLDGASLGEAVDSLPGPVMLNCTHWSFARLALQRLGGRQLERVIGLQANTASCHPLDLDGSHELRTESPDEFAEGMHALQRDFGVRILGGCCGTSAAHLRALAGRLTGL